MSSHVKISKCASSELKSKFVLSLALSAFAFLLFACAEPRKDNLVSSKNQLVGGYPTLCHTCHGSADGPAPPRDASGHTSTSFRGVGAHQTHVNESATSLGFSCETCHIVPTTIDHAIERPPILTFGSFAKLGGITPVWNGMTCQYSYCHGGGIMPGEYILTGGSNNEPNWTTVDGTQAACGTCHGIPPNSHFAEWVDRCPTCHTHTTSDPAHPHFITNKAFHINGVLDF